MLPVATTPNVKITEYPVLKYPQNPMIGPDRAVWFGEGTIEYQSIIFVYRFAANDGQGRFYALPSPMKPYPEFLGDWAQIGPLVSFAGRTWISFEADTEVYDMPRSSESGFVQMTARGTALNAGLIDPTARLAAAAVQGNRLWTLATDTQEIGGDGIKSYTFENGNLKADATFSMRPYTPDASLQLRAGPDGNTYALTLERFEGVWKISPNATLLAKYQLNNFQPVDMAFGSDGALWITTSYQYTSGMPYIVRMTTNGTRALYKIPYPGTSPRAIALGRDGAMWFIDAGTNAIGRITMSGAVTEYPVPTRNAFAATAGNAGGIVACPVSVAACGSGDMWFTEPNTSKLGRIHIDL